MPLSPEKLAELRDLVEPGLIHLRPAWAFIETLLPDPGERWIVLLLCLRRVERSARFQGLPVELMREGLTQIVDQIERNVDGRTERA